MSRAQASHQEVSPIRNLVALAVLAAACGVAAAYTETHRNEITAPVAVYVADRIDALSALATPTKADKKELKILKGLARTLAKDQAALKGDFKELVATGVASGRLGAAAATMTPSLTEAFVRAGLSLSERDELARDHLAVLSDPKHKVAIQSSLAIASKARSDAELATTTAKRATLLAKADTFTTKALVQAEKYVLKDRGADFLPPTRLRSGDVVDARGGRVAVPRDSGSTIAGASVVIPEGVFQPPFSATITLSPATSFVGGRDLAAGPAVAVVASPAPPSLGAGVPLFVPYALPTGATPTDLALFDAGPPVGPISPVTLNTDGTLSARIAAFSTFQAGVAAPPPGQPGGAYRVQTFAINTAVDLTGDGVDRAGVLVGVIDQTVTFRRDHTASASLPTFSAATRTFTRAAAPHHADDAQSLFIGSSDFAWTAGTTGRFSFTLPLAGLTQAQVQGVASDDGRVVSWSGGGGDFQFVAIGVKTDASSGVTADLAGRWAAVEMGVQFLDGDVEPFRTVWSDAFRSFTATSAGAVSFDAAGSRFQTELTYRTDIAAAPHERGSDVLGDGGDETWTVGANGRFISSDGLRYGWFDKAAGLLVGVRYDGPNRAVSMLVAVPQPATANLTAIPGLYHLAGLDVGTEASVPATTSSKHDVTPMVGALDVATTSSAQLSLDATTRSAYELTGVPALPTITWTMVPTTASLAASAASVTLALDAAGNHVAPSDPTWFAFSGDGRYVLGLTRGEATRLARGISIGLR
jgi:hypothetical protein